jgi:hypothetical protein
VLYFPLFRYLSNTCCNNNNNSYFQSFVVLVWFKLNIGSYFRLLWSFRFMSIFLLPLFYYCLVCGNASKPVVVVWGCYRKHLAIDWSFKCAKQPLGSLHCGYYACEHLRVIGQYKVDHEHVSYHCVL